MSASIVLVPIASAANEPVEVAEPLIMLPSKVNSSVAASLSIINLYPPSVVL